MLRPKAHCCSCSGSALGPSLPSTGAVDQLQLGSMWGFCVRFRLDWALFSMSPSPCLCGGSDSTHGKCKCMHCAASEMHLDQPQAQQPFVTKRPRSAAGKVCVNAQHVASTGHPAARRPLGCIFPAVGLVRLRRYMDAFRGHSSRKRSL